MVKAAWAAASRVRVGAPTFMLLAAALVCHQPAIAQLAISEGGLPSYHHPINVPPGVAGMSPKLGLSYSGDGLNGSAGHGWSVSGISSISRCSSSLVIDGNRRGVVGGQNDKLCLDGQRLIQTNAAGSPVAFPQANDAIGKASGAFTEFRTEKDSFARIRAYGYADGTTAANGPAYFRVWTKSGQIYEYGKGPASASDTNALVSPTGKSYAMTWAVARISDTLGNTIDFKYELRDVAWGSGPTAGASTTGREWNLKEVQYSGNKAVFNYTDRVLSAGAPAEVPQDRAEAYHQGSKTLTVRRLQSVTTYVNSPNTALGPNGGTAVKTTKLTHEIGAISGRSRVKAVQECAGDAGSARCLPPTEFTYAEGGADAYTGNVPFLSSPLATLDMQNAEGTSGVLLGDFNGDARSDVIYWSDTPAQNKLYTSNGDGSFTLSTTFNLKTSADRLFKSDECYYSTTADFNGDGVTDILRVMRSSSKDAASCGTRVHRLYLAQGDGSFVASAINSAIDLSQFHSSRVSVFDCTPQPCFSGPWLGYSQSEGRNYLLIDVNGDAILDIVTAILPGFSVTMNPPSDASLCASMVCTRVFIGDGTGGFTEQTTTNVANRSLYVAAPGRGVYITNVTPVTDIDGDGLSDVAGDVGVWISQGNGNFTPPTTNSSGLSCRDPIDFNGDGRADCVFPQTAVANQKLRVNDGTAVLAPVGDFNLNTAGFELGGTGVGIQIADINGDGRQDIVRVKDAAAENALYISNGDGTFTKSPTFGFTGISLKKSDGTAGFVVGDFTGKGNAEILAMSTSLSGFVSNKLFLKTDSVWPDMLVAVKSSSGATTDLYYVPLSNSVPNNGVSASLGARYASDRGTANAATGSAVDLTLPMYVVATTAADVGVGSSKLKTEYSYAGLKADLNGRGAYGFRRVLRQSTAPDGSAMTLSAEYLQAHPYAGMVSASKTYWGTLDAIDSSPVLSTTTNVYCDQTNAAAAAAATSSVPCPVTAKLQKPFLYKSTESGQDLDGNALPTVTTTNTYSNGLDVLTITQSTTGTVAGINQTFTKTTTNDYQTDSTGCADFQTCTWVLGRLTQAQVSSQVPNSLASIVTSAGTNPNASATAGSGATPGTATLTAALAFGSVALGSSSNLTATLTNSGGSALSITVPSSASVTGTDFSFVATTCTTSLASSASCTVTVRFTPTAISTRNGQLSVATSAGTVSSTLSGTGTGSVATLTSATALSFGNVVVGATVPKVSWTFRNDGNAPLTLTLSMVNTPFSLFSNGCTSIAANGTCSITAAMATGTAGSYSQTAIAITGAKQGNRSDLSLAGAVITPGAPSLTPALAFGTKTIGTNSNLVATLTNTGGSTLSLTVPTSSSVTGADFSFVSTSCTASLAASTSCDITVKFAPSAATTRSGQLSVSTGAGPVTSALSGTGSGSVAVLTSSASLSFGNVFVGATMPQAAWTFRNDGNAAMSLNLSTLNTPFSLVGNGCVSVASGSSCSITARMGTGSAATFSQTGVAITGAQLGNRSDLSQSGSVYAASLTSSLAFGAVTVGASPTLVATLANSGAGAVAMTVPTAASVTGADFSFVSTTCTSNLAASTSCTVTVRFAPTAMVARNGELTVTTGAGALRTTLSGSGTGSKATLTNSAAQSFGSATQGATAPQVSWNFLNEGNAAMTLSLSTLNSPFSVVTNGCTSVSPTASCSIVAQMGTGSVGTFSQSSIAVSGAQQGNRSDLSLGGTVNPAGTFSYVSGTHSNLGSTGDIATATIKNTGSVAIGGISFSCGSGVFVPYGTPPTSIASNATALFQCRAVAGGGYSVTITLTGSPATNSPFVKSF